jgi:uncharacterized membrane protein YqaE (UPF0057 family)
MCRFIAAVILPPLGVWMEVGCTKDLLINILLTILIWIPGGCRKSGEVEGEGRGRGALHPEEGRCMTQCGKPSLGKVLRLGDGGTPQAVALLSPMLS